MIEQNGLYYWDALGLYRNLKDRFSSSNTMAQEADCFGIVMGRGFRAARPQRRAAGQPALLSQRHRGGHGSGSRHRAAGDAVFAHRHCGMRFNTVYQLFARVQGKRSRACDAKTLLFSRICTYFSQVNERNRNTRLRPPACSTMANCRRWDAQTMDALQIPKRIFTDVDFAGTLRGHP